MLDRSMVGEGERGLQLWQTLRQDLQVPLQSGEGLCDK